VTPFLIEGSAPKTIAAGVLLLALSAVGWLVLQHSISIFSGNQIRGDPGPFFLSNLCLSVIAIAGACLLALGVGGAVGARGQGGPVDRAAALRAWGLPLGFVATLACMPLAMDTVGTIPSVAVFTCVWVYILLVNLGGHSWLHAVEAVLFGAGTAGVVQVLFVRLLTLPLPN
jgi:hypothetical protein